MKLFKFNKENKKHKNNAKPIYELIKEEVEKNGELPSSFFLPYHSFEYQNGFFDGAIDGMEIYHMGVKEGNISFLVEILKKASQCKFEEAQEELEKYFKENDERMINLIDPLQKWIIENENIIHKGNIYIFAMEIINSSKQIESVKYALSLLELINLRTDNDFRDMVCTISLSDEFTLFGLFIIRTWADANDVIYNIAQKIHGWGKIHTIELLEPTTEEIKEWLFHEGIINNVMEAYSALTVTNKINFELILRNGLSSEKNYNSAGKLMLALLDEGPVDGLSAIENKNEIIELYCNLSESDYCTENYYFSILKIISYFEKEKNYTEFGQKIIKKAHTILESERCYQNVKKYLKEGRGAELAKELGIECK